MAKGLLVGQCPEQWPGLVQCGWFSAQITGAERNDIKAVATLFDFTVFFSRRPMPFLHGVLPSTFRLNKMVGIGLP